MPRIKYILNPEEENDFDPFYKWSRQNPLKSVRQLRIIRKETSSLKFKKRAQRMPHGMTRGILLKLIPKKY